MLGEEDIGEFIEIEREGIIEKKWKREKNIIIDRIRNGKESRK